MEIMDKTIIHSTGLRQQIIQEINLIPDENLDGLYQVIHYFRLGSQVVSNGAVTSNNGCHFELLDIPEDSNISKNRFDSTTENEQSATSDRTTMSSLDDSTDISDLEKALRAQGWAGHGIFKDDPEFLKLFDEIEEERNRHWVGGE